MKVNFEKMTIEELEEFRAAKQLEIERAQQEFMAAGVALNKKLQFSDLTEKRENLARQQAEIEEKLHDLGGGHG
jgi:hypothetical protein